jgi:hypothetical protein
VLAGVTTKQREIVGIGWGPNLTVIVFGRHPGNVTQNGHLVLRCLVVSWLVTRGAWLVTRRVSYLVPVRFPHLTIVVSCRRMYTDVNNRTARAARGGLPKERTETISFYARRVRRTWNGKTANEVPQLGRLARPRGPTHEPTHSPTSKTQWELPRNQSVVSSTPAIVSGRSFIAPPSFTRLLLSGRRRPPQQTPTYTYYVTQ